jgi:hypothetical protein
VVDVRAVPCAAVICIVIAATDPDEDGTARLNLAHFTDVKFAVPSTAARGRGKTASRV